MYIIFIPALGIVSSIVATFSRRQVFGYLVMVLALVSTPLMGFGLWVHHMSATDVPRLGQSFFTAASMMIAIPSATQIFCWMATLWDGKPRLQAPLQFVLGFFFVFVLGGLTGVMLAAVRLDLQVHHTFFIVAHFHYGLIGGAVFPLFGGFYYWFPKLTGRILNERVGAWNFWLLFVGFNMTFFTMHQLGLQGMPRRVYTYMAEMGWGDLNVIASLGAPLIVFSVLVFISNVLGSMRRGQMADDNPWHASTLEWATDSPPPPYNFLHLPTVSSREPLWAQSADRPSVTGLRHDIREVLITSVLDAEPDHRARLPVPSIWPFVSALAVTGLFIGTIFTPWAVPIGSVPVIGARIAWLWPSERDHQEQLAMEEGA